MSILTDLFLTFARIGCFTFGGGYAMIALISDACVEKKKWISHDEMLNVTVAAESTPGPIAINCATHIGYRQAGMIGAAIATLGIVLPSFLIIFALAHFLEEFLGIGFIAAAFQGIKIAVGLIILDAGLGMLARMKKKALPLAIMGCSCACMLAAEIFSLPVSSLSLLGFAALAGLSAMAFKGQKAKGRQS